MPYNLSVDMELAAYCSDCGDSLEIDGVEKGDRLGGFIAPAASCRLDITPCKNCLEKAKNCSGGK